MARVHVMNKGGWRAIEVVLSRRNLLALLGKLDMPGSARTILNNDCLEDGALCPFTADEAKTNPLPRTMLVLRAEEDFEHYSRRPAPPGEMHPQTEQFVRAHGGWSRTGD